MELSCLILIPSKSNIMIFKRAILQLLIIGTIWCNQHSTAFGQSTAKRHITGFVVDSATNKPLQMVTIRLKKASNETIQVRVTEENGSFNFTQVSPASYTIAVEAIGYAPKRIPIDSLTFISQTIDLKSIGLAGRMLGLKEVAITGDRQVIMRKADRIIYDLKADPESKSNNVLAMMPKIPYLSLDGDDNVLMKGNPSFKVLINGKPAGSIEGNLKAVLKSIPASSIEKIEVITTPPSKYDAEGLAGIINIITSKENNAGSNGSLNINESIPVGGPGLGGAFTAKSGRFGISSFGGASIYRSPRTFNTNKRIDAMGTILKQEGSQHSKNKTAYFGTELSYLADSLNLLTAHLNYNGSRANGYAAQLSELSGLNGLLQQYGLENETKAIGYGIDAGINYELGFKSIHNSLLSFSYLFSTNLNDKNGFITFDTNVNFPLQDFRQTDHQRFKENTIQIDFLTTVKKIHVEAGIKGILRSNSSNFDYSSLNSTLGGYETDPVLSNSFSNTQNVFSAYNSYQLNLNSWSINAGVRLEKTVIRADFSSTSSTADQNYFNVIPSVALAKDFQNRSNINFSFSQRIRRPGINRLNPYVDRSNPNYEVTGNANLRPVLLNSLQFGYSNNNKMAVNLGLDYSFMNNLDLQVITFNPLNQISRATYANTGQSSSAGANLNLSYPVTSNYTTRLNGNAMYLWLSGQDSGQSINNDLLMYAVTLSNVLRLSHGWALNADVGLNSRNPTGLQGYTNGFFSSAFNFNKDVIKERFSIAGGIKNPFKKYRNTVSKSFGPQFSQIYENRIYFRTFNVSLNYNFGKLKETINKNKVGITNNDVAN
jgi:ferric enterobactin receptor